ncbi:MAG: hypothetical protein FWC75_06310 [Oscillospiraceae bacterium]|nr:hypothetical protein [Oscillospiraceae bacterium]
MRTIAFFDICKNKKDTEATHGIPPVSAWCTLCVCVAHKAIRNVYIYSENVDISNGSVNNSTINARIILELLRERLGNIR